MPPIPAGTQMIDLSSQAALYALGRLRDRFFGGRRFSPGTPLQPISPTSGAPDAALNAPLPTAPRQFQYPAYVNIVPAPRREYPQLTPFQLLRNLATAYDIAALCIATRIEQFQGLGWAITAIDKRQHAALQSECAALERWWAQPDGQQDFSAWLSMYLRDIYQIDAATLYPRRDVSGRLHSLEVVDGATIKPVLDDRGRTVGYQQILYGMPETQFQRPGDEDTIPDFAVDELIYRPRWPSSFSPYGCPPTEWIITRIKTALAKQAFDLSMFTEGNIPAALATPPEGQLNPEQVAQFQDWFNATLEGDIARGHKLLFLPWAARIERLKELTEGGRYESSLDDYMLKITLAAFGVTPSEIGMTDDVNRATGESQENVTYRRGIMPLAVWLKQGFDRSLVQLTGEYRAVVSLPGQPTRTAQRLCDLVAWRWSFGESEDLTRLAQTDQVYYTIGVLSPNEIRAMRFADEVEGDAPGPPSTGAPPLPGVPVDGNPQATKGIQDDDDEYPDDDIEKRHAGKHNQKTHGRATARVREGRAAYREGRADGLSPSEARAYAKERGTQKEGERNQRLARMQLKGEAPALHPMHPDRAAKTHESDEAANAALIKQSSTGALSTAETTAVNWYQGTGYEAVNDGLRGRRALSADDQHHVNRTVSNLDTVMQRSRLRESAEVYRGMTIEDDTGRALLAKLRPGATYRDPGYLSTTASQEAVRSFGYGEAGRDGSITVSMRIHAPAGTPGAYMPAINPNRGGNEYELLLGRDLTYRVTHRTESEGQVTLDLTVIPG